MKQKRLLKEFFCQDALTVAEQLLGKFLCRKTNGQTIKKRITETEAYLGKGDSASHASRAKTPRTKVMFKDGGVCYVYLCYGIHFLLNIVTGHRNKAEGVLIRGTENAIGPGKVTKLFNIDRSLNGTSVAKSDEIWIEDDGKAFDFQKTKRIGIDYAAKEDRDKLFRFVIKPTQ